MDARPEASVRRAETFTLFVVSALLILSSTGNANLMFGISLIAAAGLFIWFLANRKTWLAIISASVFVASLVVSATKLY